MLTPRYSWLNSLKATQLARIAVAIGVPSSGRKSAVVESICAALGQPPDGSRIPKKGSTSHKDVYTKGQQIKRSPGDSNQYLSTNLTGPASIVSIDMGIRTLAYAHLKIPPVALTSDSATGPERAKPTLNAWQCLSIATKPSTSLSQTTPNLDADALDADARAAVTQPKESFSPDLYAHYAYDLVKGLISRFNPTHVLIERQRFRSGGNSAVLDWTIRVGVFEGMLHAAFRTICEERSLSIHILPVEPKRVARYWLGDKASPDGVARGARKKRASSKEVKTEKIDVVGRWLERDSDAQRPLGPIEETAQPTATAYLEKWHGKTKGVKASDSILRLSKLDDLADSLLQGLTYVEWQKWKADIGAKGPEALLGDAHAGVASSKPRRSSTRAKKS